MNPQSKPLPPPYFKLHGPGHFYVRPDLLDELCYNEALEKSLPSDRASHARWLKRHGLKDEDFALEKVRDTKLRLAHQVDNDRYILRTSVLRGNRYRSYLITPSLNYSAYCEGTGLFEFVLLRAVAYAAWRGVSHRNAWDYLHVASVKEPHSGPQPISPKWSVGFESGTGLCTILASGEPNTEALFLGGKPGYYIPKFPS